MFIHSNLISFCFQSLKLLEEHALLILHLVPHTRQLVVKNCSFVCRGNSVDVVQFLGANFLHRAIAVDRLLLGNRS